MQNPSLSGLAPARARQLQISQKLALLVGSGLLMLAAVGLVGYRAVLHLTDDIQMVGHERLVVIQTLHTIHQSLHRVRQSLLEALAQEPDQPTQDEFSRILADRTAAFAAMDDGLQHYAQWAPAPAAAVLWQQLQTDHARWGQTHALVTTLLERLASNPPPAERAAIFRQLHQHSAALLPLFRQVQTDLEQVTQFHRTLTDQTIADSLHDTDIFRAEVLALMLVTLAISGYLCARILKRVNHEIARGNAAASHLRKLSQAVEQSPESIVITDQHGTIEFVNNSLLRTNGHSREELIGNNPRMLQSSKTPPETYRALWAALRQGNVWTGEFINRRKDGTEYTAFAIISPIRQADGSITHYVAVMDDVTEKNNTARELQQHRQHLLEMETERDRTADALRVKSEFLANMSHEIRTPLNVVIGFAELCLQLELPARGRDYVSKISVSAESLLGIVNDVLDVSKMEAGKLEFEHIAFNPNAVLERVASMFNHKAAEKGIAMDIACSPHVPKHLLGDPLRLGQILINLVGNALKFTKAGHISLHAGLHASDPASATLEFTVRDSGIGMTAQQLDSSFTAFTQADSSITRQYGGTGLGLSISKQLVARMQGQIQVQSTLGVGSCFSFTARFELPEMAALPVAPMQAPPTAPLRVIPDLRGTRILLVDDNDFNREIAQAQLDLTGATVDTAENGALAVAAVNQQRYDLVLMDLQMPVLDGCSAARILRHQWPDLPIVALTAHAMAEEKDRVLAAGMNDILTKPVLPQQLYATLCHWLHNRSSTPHAPPHKEIDLCQN